MDRPSHEESQRPELFWYKRYKTHTKNPLLKKSKKLNIIKTCQGNFDNKK